MDVTRLIVEGHSSKEIGRVLGISPLTVAKHRRDIFRLLGVRSAAQLCREVRSGNGASTLTE
jgi:DNA-binding CsgD family transcriptional regulator